MGKKKNISPKCPEFLKFLFGVGNSGDDSPRSD